MGIAPWILPIFLAATGVYGLFLYKFIAREFSVRKWTSYRHKYLGLVRKLEHLTLLLNQYAPAILKAHRGDLIERLDRMTHLFENLLTLVKDVPPFGKDRLVLESALFLADDFSKKLNQLIGHVSSEILAGGGERRDQSRQGDEQALKKPAGEALGLGCYFCSRPFTHTGLAKIKVKVSGFTKSVFGCSFCRAELKKNGKVKILYFMRDGTPHHWSQVSEYNPVRDFSTLGEKQDKMKDRKLELVYSASPKDGQSES